jgi:hypothetical protein
MKMHAHCNYQCQQFVLILANVLFYSHSLDFSTEVIELLSDGNLLYLFSKEFCCISFCVFSIDLNYRIKINTVKSVTDNLDIGKLSVLNCVYNEFLKTETKFLSLTEFDDFIYYILA